MLLGPGFEGEQAAGRSGVASRCEHGEGSPGGLAYQARIDGAVKAPVDSEARALGEGSGARAGGEHVELYLMPVAFENEGNRSPKNTVYGDHCETGEGRSRCEGAEE